MADPHLFRPKPPDPGRRDLIKDLFVARKGEIRHGLGILGSPEPINEVLTVHGPTRIGKSHLVLRLLEELAEPDFLQVRVNANYHKEAASVFQSIFIELRNKLWLVDEAIIPADSQLLYGFVKNYLYDLQDLLSYTTEEMTFTRSLTYLAETAWELGGAAALPWPVPLLPKMTGKTQVQEAAGESLKVKRPNEQGLVEWIQFAADASVQCGLARTILIFVDDLDLLDEDEPQPGRKSAPDIVMDGLKNLAALPSLRIVTTVRDYYFYGRAKDFFDLLSVGPLVREDLKEIYRRHVARLNRGDSPFSEEAIDFLAHSAEGIAGAYMHHLYQVYRRSSIEGGAGRQATLDGVLAHLQEEIEQLRRSVPASRGVFEAIQRGELEFQPAPGADPIRRTALENNLVYRSNYDQRVYTVDRTYAEAFRRLQPRA